ncbi:hypothetical protein [Paractinoplanes deccanensis]|nr:hypothetical protein [Actinoplanes deccanensis]
MTPRNRRLLFPANVAPEVARQWQARNSLVTTAPTEATAPTVGA